MTQAFDSYRDDYERVVQDSIAFSGLKHDFFLQAKVMRLAALFEAHFGPDKPSLLDLGCGVGRMHPLLKPHVSRLAGADVSAESLERARRDNPFAAYAPIADDGGLPHPDRAFDATLAVCVLHHVPPPARARFMAEMRRVTRPGGLAVIIEHNPFNPLTRLAVARCPFDHDAVLLSARESRRLLEDANCAAVSSEHFLLLPTLRPWAQRIERMVEAVPLGAQHIAIGVAR
jgi:SAM-dependent methyltransferase